MARCRSRSRRSAAAELRGKPHELAAAHPRWGGPRLTWLLRREGLVINHRQSSDSIARMAGPASRAEARRGAPRPAARAAWREHAVVGGLHP